MSSKIIIKATAVIALLNSFCLASSPFCPDLTPNDRIDFADFAILANNWHKTGSSLQGDFGGDGTVDEYDLAYLANNWLETIECKNADFNLDYKINFLDYAKFANAWLINSSSPNWDDKCDLDFSDLININDLKLLCNRWLKTYPEPNDNFDAFKNALASGNVQMALTFVADSSQTQYSEIFQAMGANLSNFAAGMGTLTLQSQDEDTAIYEMAHQDGSITFSFPVVFVKDSDGNWKIFNI